MRKARGTKGPKQFSFTMDLHLQGRADDLGDAQECLLVLNEAGEDRGFGDVPLTGNALRRAGLSLARRYAECADLVDALGSRDWKITPIRATDQPGIITDVELQKIAAVDAIQADIMSLTRWGNSVGNLARALLQVQSFDAQPVKVVWDSDGHLNVQPL